MPDGPDLHERFIEHTLAHRDDVGGRRLLALEWPYLETLMGGRLSAPLDMLDLACGTGHQSLAWAERGFRVAGCDLDLRLLRAARERLRHHGEGPAGVQWSCADATRLPYASGSFDIVFNNSLLEHVPRWEQVLAETARVLRPRGLYVMYTTNRLSPLQQEVNHFPFYGWLPDAMRRRVLAWIMPHRRELVNYTALPAVHWFTFPGVRRDSVTPASRRTTGSTSWRGERAAAGRPRSRRRWRGRSGSSCRTSSTRSRSRSMACGTTSRRACRTQAGAGRRRSPRPLAGVLARGWCGRAECNVRACLGY